VVKEMFAVGKGLLEGAEGTTNPLIAAVVADFKGGNRPATPAERPQDLAQVKALALSACRDVTALLVRKAPGEAEGFKRWLLGTAQRTAEAAKEGGVFGIGGVPVSAARVLYAPAPRREHPHREQCPRRGAGPETAEGHRRGSGSLDAPRR
jgi:hypothetical protein